ncbi:MAG: NnrU family protein [Polyangiaceae bacterium]
MNTLLLGLLLFLGIHSVAIVAPAWRDRTAAQLGLAWRALYSAISLVGLIMIVRGYAAARFAPIVLYVPPAWTRHATMTLMLPVFPLLLAAYLPGRIKARLKHPMLVATKLWATAHLLSNGMLADLLLFGGFLVWAVADRIAVKHRPTRPIKTAPVRSYNDWLAIAAGLVLYIAMLAWGTPRPDRHATALKPVSGGTAHTSYMSGENNPVITAVTHSTATTTTYSASTL